MRNTFKLITAVIFALSATAIEAATVTPAPTFNVTATVPKLCTVAVIPDLAFGTYTPFGGQITATTAVSLKCTGSTIYSVALNKGSTTGGTISQRLMANGASTLQYNLYTDAALSTLFGDNTNGVAVTGTGSGMAVGQTVTVYGVLPDNPTNQAAAAGAYSDTITVTVTYN